MTATVQPLARLLARHTREGELYEKLEGSRVRCFACGHRCLIPPGRDGICRVRFNEDGSPRVPFGYVGGLQRGPGREEAVLPRPPGSAGALLRDAGLRLPLRLTARTGSRPRPCGIRTATAPAQEHGRRRAIVAAAQADRRRAIVTSTYNEPLITSEWAVGGLPRREGRGPPLLLRLERQRHPGGAGLPARPACPSTRWTSRASATARYRDLGGTLERVLWTIRALHASGIWVEVVTLVVPGLQRLDGGAARHRAVPGLGVAGHPLARDGVSPGLPDGGPGAAPRCAALLRAAEIGRRGGAALRLCREPPRGRAQLGEHLLPRLPGPPRRAARLPRAAEPRGRRRPLPRLPAGRPRGVGLRHERPRSRRERGLSCGRGD